MNADTGTVAGFGKYPWINDKELTEEYFWTHAEKDVYEFRQKLYAREKFVKFNKGSVLFYRHDVWHRGRPILINHQRIVCNMVFKKSNNDRVNHWNPGFGKSPAYSSNYYNTFRSEILLQYQRSVTRKRDYAENWRLRTTICETDAFPAVGIRVSNVETSGSVCCCLF